MDYENETWHECKRCDGQKIIPRYIHGLSEVCPQCGGSGGRDWVANAMDRYEEKEKDLSMNVAQSNIQRLIHMIYEEAANIGIQVKVNVEPIPHTHQKSYSVGNMASHVHTMPYPYSY